MKHIQIKCDRCGKAIDGAVGDVPILDESRATVGFYDLNDKYWARFARKSECYICDGCMFEDPAYRETCVTER